MNQVASVSPSNTNAASRTSGNKDGHVGLAAVELRVVYDGFVAVENTSLQVAPGESFGIVGESGSGKSTVLRAICGLAPLASGKVQLISAGNGSGDSKALPAPGSKAFRRLVQMVFQDPYGSLHPRQTVDRILAEPLAIHGIDDAETRIERALETVTETTAGTGMSPFPRFLANTVLIAVGTTVLALIPTAIGTFGDSAQRVMAISIIGGLTISNLASVIFYPLVFSMYFNHKKGNAYDAR